MERIIRNTYLTNSNLSVSLIVRIFDKVYALFKGVRKLYQNRYLHTKTVDNHSVVHGFFAHATVARTSYLYAGSREKHPRTILRTVPCASNYKHGYNTHNPTAEPLCLDRQIPVDRPARDEPPLFSLEC